MAFTAGSLYLAITSFSYTDSGVTYRIHEGDVLLGSKITGAPDGYFVLLGSTPAEILTAKRAAGIA